MSAEPYDARDIANFFLDLGAERGVSLTQISIQKTVFYSHGWYLVFKSKPLIKNEFEAWAYGPVVRVLRDQFRKFGRSQITARAAFFDPITAETYQKRYQIEPSDEQFLRWMFGYYSKIEASELIRMTHKSGAPWDAVMGNKEVANLGRVISNEMIHSYFELLFKNSPAISGGTLLQNAHPL